MFIGGTQGFKWLCLIRKKIFRNAMLKLGILVSGRGSNLGAILDAIAGDSLKASVQLVLSSHPNALALDRAKCAHVPFVVLDYSSLTRVELDEAMILELNKAQANFIVMAGFRRIVTKKFLDAFQNRVINIHPSLLPDFPGLHAVELALQSGENVTGCTVHYVEEKVDAGQIIGQKKVLILPGDTVESLAYRILKKEHELIVEVLQNFESVSRIS